MVNEHPIKEFLNSSDPLSVEAIKFLVAYKEEDDLVDYKLTLDPRSAKKGSDPLYSISKKGVRPFIFRFQ